MDHLNWKEPIQIDESIDKIDYREYDPQVGTNVNQDSGDIRITIQDQDQFVLPSKSFIYIEGIMKYKNGNNILANDHDVSIVNNALMYLFKRASYRLANQEIEGCNNLGRATTMKSLITYPSNYSEGMNFFWHLDTPSPDDKPQNGEGFKQRGQYIIQQSNPTGKFSAMVPLSHIFGFCENYDKVIYGVKHELILTRTNTHDAIYRAIKLGDDGEDTIKDCKININKLRWRVPHVTISDEYKLKLYSQIEQKASVFINFLNRQCESTTVPDGVREHVWRLGASAGSEKPRYIVLGFQTDKDNEQTKNCAVFDHCSIINSYVELNSQRYPEMDLQLQFKNNIYSTAYSMLCDYYNNVLNKEGVPMKIIDYRALYPILVFDISRQSERLKNSVTDITIKTRFSVAIPVETMAYALILSDREIKLQSDGNKMNVIH